MKYYEVTLLKDQVLFLQTIHQTISVEVAHA